MAVSRPIMVRFSIRKKLCNLQVSRIIKNKTDMQFFYSIGPKIGTSVAPPSMKSTEHGISCSVLLNHVNRFMNCYFYNHLIKVKWAENKTVLSFLYIAFTNGSRSFKLNIRILVHEGHGCSMGRHHYQVPPAGEDSRWVSGIVGSRPGNWSSSLCDLWYDEIKRDGIQGIYLYRKIIFQFVWLSLAE